MLLHDAGHSGYYDDVDDAVDVMMMMMVVMMMMMVMMVMMMMMMMVEKIGGKCDTFKCDVCGEEMSKANKAGI